MQLWTNIPGLTQSAEIKTKSSTEMGIDIVESNDVADQKKVYKQLKLC